MGFRATIEDGSSGRRDSFFSFEGRFETFFDESFADIGDGLGVALKLFRDIAVAHATVFGFIDGEEDIGVFDFLGTALAGGDEFGQFGSFFAGQGHFVNLLHGDFLVRG